MNTIEKYNNIKKAKSIIQNIFEKKDRVLIIHYSCESFYDIQDRRTPRITSIAVKELESSQTHSFSIHKFAEIEKIDILEIHNKYDYLEKMMLDSFFRFVSKKEDYIWVHWNMRDINYGFQAIEHRYEVLGGVPESIIQDNKKVDLAKIIIDIYGTNYIEHPRLPNIIKLNSISQKDFLTGEEEASAWRNKEYIKLHLSTLRKTDILVNLLQLIYENKLKTKTKKIEKIYIYLHPKIITKKIKEHWAISLISIILLLIKFKDFLLHYFN